MDILNIIFYIKFIDIHKIVTYIYNLLEIFLIPRFISSYLQKLIKFSSKTYLRHLSINKKKY